MDQPGSVKTKILVVDDSQDLADLIVQQLLRMGYDNVEVANDGREAYNLCVQKTPTTEKFDLIISDLRMPKMTGLELLRYVRNNAHLSETGFIMITGHSDKVQVQEAISLRVDEFLTKPHNEASLETKVKRVLAKSGKS